METTLNFDDSIEKDCSDKGKQFIVDCIKNRTLLFPLGVLDRTETNDGYIIGLQPIKSIGTMPMRIDSRDIDKLKITFKEVFNVGSIEEENNED